MKRGTYFCPGGKLLWVFLVFSLFVAQSALAEDASGNASQKEQQARLEARERYKQGKDFYDSALYEKALTEFSAAYDVRPHPVVLKSVAECYVMLNRIPEAIETLELYLQSEKATGKGDVEQRVQDLRRQLATLEVKSEPLGAKVFIDGNDTGKTTPCVLEVGPGEHQVGFDAEGYERLAKTVFLDSGQSETVAANFPMEGTPVEQQLPGSLISPFDEEDGEGRVADDTSSSPPAGFWVCAALVGVGLVSGTVFGTMALNSEDDYKKNYDPESKEAGEREAIIADVSFGVALASALVGTIVLLTYDKGEKKEELAKKRDRNRVRVTGLAGRDTVGLNAAIAF